MFAAAFQNSTQSIICGQKKNAEDICAEVTYLPRRKYVNECCLASCYWVNQLMYVLVFIGTAQEPGPFIAMISLADTLSHWVESYHW